MQESSRFETSLPQGWYLHDEYLKRNASQIKHRSPTCALITMASVPTHPFPSVFTCIREKSLVPRYRLVQQGVHYAQTTAQVNQCERCCLLEANLVK